MESEGAAWSPYLVGALIGVLSMATFYFPADKPRGITTSYARLAGLIGNLFSKSHRADVVPIGETGPSGPVREAHQSCDLK